jgi:hypothetical protein
VAHYTSLGIGVENENCILKEVKGTFSLENACYSEYPVSFVVYENMNIKQKLFT